MKSGQVTTALPPTLSSTATASLAAGRIVAGRDTHSNAHHRTGGQNRAVVPPMLETPPAALSLSRPSPAARSVALGTGSAVIVDIGIRRRSSPERQAIARVVEQRQPHHPPIQDVIHHPARRLSQRSSHEPVSDAMTGYKSS